MVIGIERISRQQLILLVLLTMLAGLFFSRVLLSVSMIVFMGATCFHKKILHQIRNCFRQNFFIGLAFLFFIPFISGLWSTDLREWLHVVRIKVPLLFYLLLLREAGNYQAGNGAPFFTFFFRLYLVVVAGAFGNMRPMQLPLTRTILKPNQFLRLLKTIMCGIAG
jgi:hypothetical protein